jgi:hypothetical protein
MRFVVLFHRIRCRLALQAKMFEADGMSNRKDAGGELSVTAIYTIYPALSPSPHCFSSVETESSLRPLWITMPHT